MKRGDYFLTIPAKFRVGQKFHYHFLYITGIRNISAWNTLNTEGCCAIMERGWLERKKKQKAKQRRAVLKPEQIKRRNFKLIGVIKLFDSSV